MMVDLMKTLELFVYGFIVGYVWHPVWTMAKKIWQEAKLAKTQWGKPNE